MIVTTLLYAYLHYYEPLGSWLVSRQLKSDVNIMQSIFVSSGDVLLSLLKERIFCYDLAVFGVIMICSRFFSSSFVTMTMCHTMSQK